MEKSTAIQDFLVTIVNKAASGSDTATAFLSEQIPDVIHQLLVWKMTWAGASFIICCVVILALFFGMRKLYEVVEANDGDRFLTFCVGGIAVCFGIIFFLTALVELKTVLQIWIAPKVWLIEYAAGLVKGH